jgi:spore maturation protein CgeB
MWQLFKALHEIGNEVIITPYVGHAIESLWWRTYPNPCLQESLLSYSFAEKRQIKSLGGGGPFSKLSMSIIEKYIRPKWERHLMKIMDREGNVDAILFSMVPLNHMTGVPSKLKASFNIPILYYDGDLPTSLPDYADTKAFIFNYYPGSDLSEYDAFLSSSKGAITLLQKMGARNVVPFYFAADPELFSPIEIEQDIDIFYYGSRGPQTKEKRINYMIAEPSQDLQDCYFLIGGNSQQINLGKAKACGVLPISTWRTYCCRSKINLNITKEIDAQTYATSSARPFELASMGCCIVTDAYNGFEEWFELGKEVFMAHNANEAKEIYTTLLSSEDLRRKTGEAARQRVLKEHTMLHRAKQIISIINNIPSYGK